MSNKPLIVERTFNAPAAKVWSAITDLDEMRKWYFQLKDFKLKVGFKFDFMAGASGGPQYLHLCEITEIVEGKKLAYTWRYDNYPGNSEVSWELFDKGEQTLVRITHTGLESMAENGPDFAITSFTQGWTYFLYTALKGYLEPEEN